MFHSVTNFLSETWSRLFGSKNRISFSVPAADDPQKFWNALPESIRNERMEDLETLRFNTPKLSLRTEYGTIDYVRAGNRHGKTLLFVPGVPDQIYTFHRLIQALAHDYDLLVVSAPAKGYSTYTNQFDFRMDTIAQFWRMIIHLFDLKNVTIVAFSTGLSDMLHTLCRYGKKDLRINQLISLCGWGPAILPEPLPFNLSDLMLGSADGPMLYQQFSGNKYFGLEACFMKSIHRGIRGVKVRELAHEYLRSWPKKDPQTQTFDERKIQGISQTIRTQNELNKQFEQYYDSRALNRRNLEGISTLIVGATHDQIVHGIHDLHSIKRNGTKMQYTDDQGLTYADRLFRAFQVWNGREALSRKVIIPETGHFLPLEASDEVAYEIENFLQATSMKGESSRAVQPNFHFAPRYRKHGQFQHA